MRKKVLLLAVSCKTGGLCPGGLDLDDPDAWFSTPQAARETMSLIWAEASIQQVNEIFFACMNEILACNYELTDIFKTSRLSAHSIKVVQTTMANQPYI